MKPTVLTLDTLDDRAELRTALDHLHPTERVDFLDWALDFARLVVPPAVVALFADARADRLAMAAVTLAAERGDRDASDRLTRSIYADLMTVCHNWEVELLPLAEELEVWASRRTVTPPEVAAASWQARRRPLPSSPSARPETSACSDGSTG